MSIKIETNNPAVIYENQDQYYGGGYTVKYENGEPITITIVYSNGEKINVDVVFINAWFGSFEHSDHCTVILANGNGQKIRIKDKK